MIVGEIYKPKKITGNVRVEKKDQVNFYLTQNDFVLFLKAEIFSVVNRCEFVLLHKNEIIYFTCFLGDNEPPKKVFGLYFKEVL